VQNRYKRPAPLSSPTATRLNGGGPNKKAHRHSHVEWANGKPDADYLSVQKISNL
jgi:hypothetical protein